MVTGEGPISVRGGKKKLAQNSNLKMALKVRYHTTLPLTWATG